MSDEQPRLKIVVFDLFVFYGNLNKLEVCWILYQTFRQPLMTSRVVTRIIQSLYYAPAGRYINLVQR